MQGEVLAAHTARNWQAILQVLKLEFGGASRVLEIGSGNGQHATLFAAELPQLCWQPSDIAVNLQAIRTCVRSTGLKNVCEPIELDVRNAALEPAGFDAAFSANTAHIMSEDTVQNMFRVLGRGLETGGRFCLYGPLRINGRFNSDSNAHFDASLRAEDPQMGIRDLDKLDAFAKGSQMQRSRLYAMPANNFVVVWQKYGERE